ncbi:MAG: arginine deiminase-related protein [Pseudomonadota bacterium]|nr:arginine deiminase-related protein [Pseudomonadota bacterium]
MDSPNTANAGGPALSNTLNPTRLDKPAFLMNVPFSLSAEAADNVWMVELDERARAVDLNKAISQFLQLYHFMAAEAVVYLLPTPHLTGLQDLVYCANLGIVLEHLPGKDSIVLSRFSTEIRAPEVAVGESFFHAMGYQVIQAAHQFEGEAELKHLHDNVFLGGYGTRSDRAAYDWMAAQFDMRIIPLQETDPYLYHLDCTVFPLTRQDTLVCTEMYEPEEVAQIERMTNIIDVSVEDCFSGVCNSVRLGNTLMNASHLHELPSTHEDYAGERQKNRTLEDIATRFGFEVSFFNLSEFLKSGALLSCMVMHLNRRSYDLALI